MERSRNVYENKEPAKGRKPETCHPERSEGSQQFARLHHKSETAGILRPDRTGAQDDSPGGAGVREEIEGTKPECLWKQKIIADQPSPSGLTLTHIFGWTPGVSVISPNGAS
jgi:hypothetical protein